MKSKQIDCINKNVKKILISEKIHDYDFFLEIINNGLNNLEFHNEPSRLYEPIYYSLANGGKRVRPILCLMATELFGGDYKKALYVAYGLEIFHAFTLVHDDIMDNSLIRRGKETVFKKWDKNTAILVGDAMNLIAGEFLLKTDNNFKEVFSTFSNMGLKICEGQQFDLNFEIIKDLTVIDYLKMIHLKTAVFLAGSMKIGAIIAGANTNDKNNIYEFGINIGKAFQLQDDLLDSFGDEKKFGKEIGNDIIKNKKTFLLLKAYELADKKTIKELDYWTNLKKFSKKEKIYSIINIYKKLNISEILNNEINIYFHKANNFLNKINLPYEKKQKLIDYINTFKNREV